MQNATADQLDLKLLERSLGRAEKSANAWMRDAGIFGALVLIFQFSVFQPAVRLFERQANLDEVALPLQSTEESLRQLDEVTTEIGNVLTQGREAVDELLRQAPTDLRREILALDGEMLAYRLQRNPPTAVGTVPPPPSDPSQFPGPSDFPPPTPGAAFPQTQLNPTQTPLQSSFGAGYSPTQQTISADSQPRFLEGFDPDKLELVAAPNENPTGFRNLVQQIVETNIVNPRFESFNRKKQERLDAPLARIEERLAERTLRLAAQIGEGAALFETHLAALTKSIAKLRSMRLTPPVGNPDWWRTFEGKGAVAEANRINVERVVIESQDSLGRISKTMNAAGLSFHRMLDQIKQERARLMEKLSEVERQYQDVRKLMGELGRPFTFVAAKLDHALGGFPTALLLLSAWLLWRLNRLRAHGASLYQAFVRHSASDAALKAAIPDLVQPAVWANTPGRWLVLPISATLTLLAFYDVYALRNTLAFPSATGMALFIAATLPLIWISYSCVQSERRHDDQ